MHGLGVSLDYPMPRIAPIQKGAKVVVGGQRGKHGSFSAVLIDEATIDVAVYFDKPESIAKILREGRAKEPDVNYFQVPNEPGWGYKAWHQAMRLRNWGEVS